MAGLVSASSAVVALAGANTPQEFSVGDWSIKCSTIGLIVIGWVAISLVPLLGHYWTQAQPETTQRVTSVTASGSTSDSTSGSKSHADVTVAPSMAETLSNHAASASTNILNIHAPTGNTESARALQEQMFVCHRIGRQAAFAAVLVETFTDLRTHALAIDHEIERDEMLIEHWKKFEKKIREFIAKLAKELDSLWFQNAASVFKMDFQAKRLVVQETHDQLLNKADDLKSHVPVLRGKGKPELVESVFKDIRRILSDFADRSQSLIDKCEEHREPRALLNVTRSERRESHSHDSTTFLSED